MSFKKSLSTYGEIQKIIQSGKEIKLFYFSHPDCGVCSVIKPKIEDLLSRHPQICGYHCKLEDDPMIAGQLTVYSIPMVLVYVNGKEILREGRFIVIDLLEPQIIRLLGLYS